MHIEYWWENQKYKWVDSIKMDLREIGLDGMDCIVLAQERSS
jgi:hypothetical protein